MAVLQRIFYEGCDQFPGEGGYLSEDHDLCGDRGSGGDAADFLWQVVGGIYLPDNAGHCEQRTLHEALSQVEECGAGML